MKPAEKLKRLFSDAAVTTKSAPDEAVFETIKTAYTDTAEERAAQPEPSLWRAIMKNRTTQLATAAIIVIAVLLIMRHFGAPIAGTTVAWGDVRDAFLDQPWVHLKYDNGAERWYDLKTGNHFFKDWDGRCVAINHATSLTQIHDPTHGKHINEYRSAGHRNGMIPPWEPKTAWDAVVGPWEQMAEQGKSGHWEVETSMEQTDGRQLVRFDRYHNDAAGRRLRIKTIWAAPQTRLPLMVWERLDLASRHEQDREAITGTFDFPDHGPESLYDLGIARDLPVVKHYDKTPPASVAQAINAAKDTLERFPARYRVVVWDNEQTNEVEVVWRDGKRVHHNHYFSLSPDSTSDGTSQYCLSLPATAREVLDWANTQTPISTDVFDGQKDYDRQYRHPEVSNTRDEVRVTRARSAFLMAMWSRPIELQWPWEKFNPASFELIDDAPEEFRSYIGLKVGRTERYIDPEHDYICVRYIQWKQQSGQREKEREYAYSDFTRLPTGHWYARKRTRVTYSQRGTSHSETLNIDVELLEESDFPPDTFDGQQLMQGAKLETY